MTYEEIYREGQQRLKDAGVDEHALEAWYILEEICKTDRSWYYLHGQEEMMPEEAARYREMIRNRCQRIPLQYLTGHQEFMGLTFQVSPAVLIPRQDTEVLVETVVATLGREPGGIRVLDLCTGSGCIAVSIKKLLPAAAVTGSDLSQEALALAARNGAANGVEVEWVVSDLFENITGQYQAIVSNPPYIKTGDIGALMPEVREHEPRMALDGSADGLAFYRKIAGEARAFLQEGGFLFFEIGWDQGRDVEQILQKEGYFQVEILQDLAGLDRVAWGRRGI